MIPVFIVRDQYKFRYLMCICRMITKLCAWPWHLWIKCQPNKQFLKQNEGQHRYFWWKCKYKCVTIFIVVDYYCFLQWRQYIHYSVWQYCTIILWVNLVQFWGPVSKYCFNTAYIGVFAFNRWGDTIAMLIGFPSALQWHHMSVMECCTYVMRV